MSPVSHDRVMQRPMALLLWMALTLIFAASCVAPERLSHHRSALLYPEMKPFVPEGRIRHIPDDDEALSEQLESSDQSDQQETPSGQSEDAKKKSARSEVKIAQEAPQKSSKSKRTDGLLVSPMGARGETIAQAARDKVGASTVNYPNQKTFSEDCSGLVRSIYWNSGIDLFAGGTRRDDNGVTAIYRFINSRGGIHSGRPRLGDLIFFKNTADTNRDGRWNDGLTHIGIVESIREDGTVMVVHRSSKGIVHQAMNLSSPDSAKDASGQVINDYLRGSPSPRLMGQLFYRYGTVLAPAKSSPLSQAVQKVAVTSDFKGLMSEESKSVAVGSK